MSTTIKLKTQSVYRADLDADPSYGEVADEANAWFDYAKQLGDKKDMRGAINALSRAIALDPFCGIYYRWRGHRHLNCGDIEDACADFTMASRLIPDNWDVWYHLALCCVVLGRREYALYAHKRCWDISRDEPNDSTRIAVVNWCWINLSLMGRTQEADALLEEYINADLDAGVDISYLRMCLAYKGNYPLEKLLEPQVEDDEPILCVMTQAFGLANYYLIKGDEGKYHQTINYIVTEGKPVWNCFGYACASFIQRHSKGGHLDGKGK